jgi:hypothetical protein
MDNNTTIRPNAREEGERARRAAIVVAAGALCLGAAFLAIVLVLASCSASAAAAIGRDGGARVSIEAEMPSALAAKLRKLSAVGKDGGSAARGPIFDAGSVRKSLAAMEGVELLELSQPNPDAIRALVSVRSLEELAASPDLAGSKLLAIERGPAWIQCRFRLERGDGKALSALFPGLDGELLEALSPPALDEEPLSLEEYKTMLRSVLGEKALLALEGASLRLSLTAPGPVIASSGGSLNGSTLSASIPILDILALEKPIELRLKWKSGV